jgi:hypothetical protein
MTKNKIIQFFKPTPLTGILVVVFFFTLPIPTYVQGDAPSYWTIGIFPVFGIINNWISWDSIDNGVPYYVPPNILQIAILIFILLASYLVACGIVYLVNRRQE